MKNTADNQRHAQNKNNGGKTDFFNNFVISAFPCLFYAFMSVFSGMLIILNRANVFDWGTDVIGQHTLAL